LAGSAPPHHPISLVWPDAIHIDALLIGGARLAWPPQSDEEDAPEWLVFGAMLRRVVMADRKTQQSEESSLSFAASLEDQGFEEPDSDRLIESFARHLMAIIDAWQANGFEVVTQSYLTYLMREKGAWPTIDGNGDLMLRWIGKEQPDRHSLAQALEQPTWLDPATGGLRG
jgi:hypothetical protein